MPPLGPNTTYNEEIMSTTESNRVVAKNEVIFPPTLLKVDIGSEGGENVTEIQVSAHTVKSKSFLREAKYVFPALDVDGDCRLIVLPTMQHARYDLVKVGEEIEQEKDTLLLTVSNI